MCCRCRYRRKTTASTRSMSHGSRPLRQEMMEILLARSICGTCGHQLAVSAGIDKCWLHTSRVVHDHPHTLSCQADVMVLAMMHLPLDHAGKASSYSRA